MLNFGIFMISLYVLIKKHKFIRSNELSNKIMFLTSIWYFSSIFLNWRMGAVYNEAYENLKSRYQEEEIIKLINDHSKKTHILI